MFPNSGNLKFSALNNTFRNRVFYKFNKFTHIKIKEKYSLEYVNNLIHNITQNTQRNLEKLPKEFHKFNDKIITLERPKEPEEYECCGKGCNPCVWDRYDSKLRNYEETIQYLYEKVNKDNNI